MQFRTRQAGHAKVEFGPFQLDRRARTLTRDGVPVPLGDRAFDILLVLIDHAPDVVSKAAVFELVWQRTNVEESTLRYQISTLRKTIGDGVDGARYIANVTGKGYCFVAPLSTAASALPTATSVEKPATNLPFRLSEIVGREADLAELDSWLTRHRLITVVGPGGVGKTRVAIELGHRAFERFAAGVWLVDLAPICNPQAVPGAVAMALGIPVTTTESLVDEIIATLSGAELLLIFDNCEHLADEAAKLIRRMLERVPRLSVLATSQKLLHLEAERVYSLDPLGVPPADARDIRRFPAVEFFVDRARAVDRLFQLDDGNSAGVAEICRQLDGLPLALEMATGRLRMLGITELRYGLADRLNLLKGQPDGDARHRSLQAVMEWSHELLSPLDQQVFRRLAVFPGGFSLEAAIAIASIEGVQHWQLLDSFARLVDQSLVRLERCDPARYRLLETLRLYAKDKLDQAGEALIAAELHARHFAAVYDEAERSWEEMADPDWTARYVPDLDNLRAALDWALASHDRRRIAIDLAALGFAFAEHLYIVRELHPYQARILSLLDADTPIAVRAGLLSRIALSCVRASDPDGLPLAERAATIYREIDDPSGLAMALRTIAGYRFFSGRYAEANDILADVRLLLADGMQRKNQVILMVSSAQVASALNDNQGARRYLVDALALAKSFKYNRQPVILMEYAMVEYMLGEVDHAIELSKISLAQSEMQFWFNDRGLALTNLGTYLIAADRLSEARSALGEAFSVLVEQRRPLDTCLQLWAVLAGLEGLLPEAAQLIGFTDADRMLRGAAISRIQRPLYDRLMQMLAANLAPSVLDNWKTEGAAWREGEAVDFVTTRLIDRD